MAREAIRYRRQPSLALVYALAALVAAAAGVLAFYRGYFTSMAVGI